MSVEWRETHFQGVKAARAKIGSCSATVQHGPGKTLPTTWTVVTSEYQRTAAASGDLKHSRRNFSTAKKHAAKALLACARR